VGGLSPNGWSPSDDYWLFGDGDSLYVTNANGSNIQRVYQYQAIDKCGRGASWLSNEVILIEGYGCDSNGKVWPPPHQYFFNMESGDDGRLDPVNEFDEYGTYMIQGEIPNMESWVQMNWYTGEVEIADLGGNHKKLLTDLELQTEFGKRSMAFIPDTNIVIFLAGRKDNEKPNGMLYGLWKMSLNKSPKLIIEEEPGESIREYSVSPSGELLAYTYDRGLQHMIAFYNIQNEKIEYEWVFPYRLGSLRFIWSPDSLYVMLPYSTDDHETPDKITDGIQIMDISTGATKLLVDENVWMLDWHLVD
jgi:hypothetical protein